MEQTKYIIIEDIGRTLNAIGYNFQSPVLMPSKFPLTTIGKLINMSGVTKMYEAYEKDKSMRVKLTSQNYKKPFIELWKEENPDKIFPWETEVEELIQTSKAVDELTPTVEEVSKIFKDMEVIEETFVKSSYTELVEPILVTSDAEILEAAILKSSAKLIDIPIINEVNLKDGIVVDTLLKDDIDTTNIPEPVKEELIEDRQPVEVLQSPKSNPSQISPTPMRKITQTSR